MESSHVHYNRPRHSEKRFGHFRTDGTVAAQRWHPGRLFSIRGDNASEKRDLDLLLAVQPPQLVSFSPDASRNIGPKIIEGLLRHDFDLTPKPTLATEWNGSEDGLTYTFRLRQGVKWHDGRPFTAEDAAFSIQFWKQIHPRGRATFANIQATDTPDNHTLVLRLSKPASHLLSALVSSESPTVPRHIYAGKDAQT